MKKIFFLQFLLSVFLLYAQQDKVGVNTETPSATLDIMSKGNTDATKVLEINNSSSTELLKVTN